MYSLSAPYGAFGNIRTQLFFKTKFQIRRESSFRQKAKWGGPQMQCRNMPLSRLSWTLSNQSLPLRISQHARHLCMTLVGPFFLLSRRTRMCLGMVHVLCYKVLSSNSIVVTRSYEAGSKAHAQLLILREILLRNTTLNKFPILTANQFGLTSSIARFQYIGNYFLILVISVFWLTKCRVSSSFGTH